MGRHFGRQSSRRVVKLRAKQYSILNDPMTMSSRTANWESNLRPGFVEYRRFLSAKMVSESSEISGISVKALSNANVTPPSSLPDSSMSNVYSYQFNSTTAIVILVVSCAFLFIGLMGYYLNKCISTSNISTMQQQAANQGRAQKKEGLAPEVIESFPILAYSAASMAKHSTECAVCLAEFEEGEMTRSLPQCNHAFHPECIDKWLVSHSTCPLCRISLVSDEHTIHIDSNSPQESAAQENSHHDAPVMAQEEPRGLSETSPRLTGDGVERIGEREAVLALSLSSRNFQMAALEMENREVLTTTSDRSSTSSRWINRLRRSSSLERPRTQSNKLEASGNLAESSIKEVTEKNDSSSFFSRSRSERISHNSIKAEQIN